MATAVRLGGGVIATADADDLKRIAADHPNVAILVVQRVVIRGFVSSSTLVWASVTWGVRKVETTSIPASSKAVRLKTTTTAQARSFVSQRASTSSSPAARKAETP